MKTDKHKYECIDSDQTNRGENVTTDISMPFSKNLLNFKVSNQLRDSFDYVCKHFGITRTAALVYLMREFVREKAPEIRAKQNTTQNTVPLGTSIQERKRFFNYSDVYWDDQAAL